MKRSKTPARPKSVPYMLIPETSEIGRLMYQLLAQILDEHHEELVNANARIVLAWATSWRPDVDGRLTLGKCKKASDLDRELSPYDFVILLNRDFWLNPRVTALQRRALLDHECCHMGIAYDEDAAPKVDERGRTVFRIVKHSIEEFTQVVERYGCHKADIEAFARALQRAETSVAKWIGYSRVHEVLVSIGVHVSLETIRTWPESERRDVLLWAQLRKDTDIHAMITTMPGCLAAAIREPQTGGDSATH